MDVGSSVAFFFIPAWCLPMLANHYFRRSMSRDEMSQGTRISGDGTSRRYVPTSRDAGKHIGNLVVPSTSVNEKREVIERAMYLVKHYVRYIAVVVPHIIFVDSTTTYYLGEGRKPGVFMNPRVFLEAR